MKNIDIKEDIVRRNKIPILIYTPDWIQLFSNYRSRGIQKIVDRLERFLEREKELERELKDSQRKKKILMNKILHLSNELNEKGNTDVIDTLNQSKKEILHINDRIPKILEELEELPFLLDEQNTLLLKETIKRGYELINESQKELDDTQIEINTIREQLGDLIKRKVDLEERVNDLYSYLHGIMGATEMEKLDENLLDNGK